MSTDDLNRPSSACDIERIKSYIHHHSDEELSRAHLAEMAGYSLPHFHRIFTAEIGENIAAYIRRVRLERAARKLIHGAVDLTEVALAAGYQSHTAFSKAFKQKYGYSPSDFRRLNFMVALQTIRQGKPNDKDKANQCVD